MSIQLTDTVLMIRPTRFGFNEEAFETNSFQNQPKEGNENEIQDNALLEFNVFVEALEVVGVNVLVFDDIENSTTPDSIFPNNWFSTHRSGELITYPMAVANRRAERKTDIINSLIEDFHYQPKQLEQFESSNAFLEGTGSLIFDHDNKVVYAAESPRTHLSVLEKLAEILNYEVVSFKSYGKSGELIYHTNVMMCIGESFIAIGKDTIDPENWQKVQKMLEKSQKEVIFLSNSQIYRHFTGNMLQVKNQKGERVLVLSETAFNSLTPFQINQFEKHTEHFVQAKIPTIEKIGGGSARCMLAEIFPKD